LSGYYDQTVGNFSQTIEEGAISGPIAERVQARTRVPGKRPQRIRPHLVTGHEIDNARTFSLRGKAKIQITIVSILRLSADYHKENDANYGFHYMGPGNPNVTPTGVLLGAPSLANSYDIATGRIRATTATYGRRSYRTWQINDSTSLKSITDIDTRSTTTSVTQPAKDSPPTLRSGGAVKRGERGAAVGEDQGQV